MTAVEFSPDGKLFVSVSTDRTEKLWNWRTGALLGHLEGQLGLITTVAFSPDSQLLVLGNVGGAVKL